MKLQAIAIGLATMMVSTPAWAQARTAANCYQDRKPELKLTACTALAKRSPRDSYAYSNRGYAYALKGDYDRAIRDLDEAIRLEPTYATGFANRGEAWRQRGDIDRAIMDLSEAIRLDPSVTQAYVSRGQALEAKGDIEQAKFDFSTALTRAPEDSAAAKEAIAKARERLDALEAVTGATGGGRPPASGQ